MKRKPGVVDFIIGITVLGVLGFVAIWGLKSLDRGATDSRRTTDTISLTKSDIRSISVALEAYCVDWSMYPLPKIEYLVNEDGIATGSVQYSGGAATVPPALLVPIAYLTSIPGDPFSPGASLSYMQYICQDSNGRRNTMYIIQSHGPDGDIDLPIDEFRPVLDSSGRKFDPAQKYGLPRPFLTYMFDPTNGVNSDGDIFQFSRLLIPMR